MHGSMRCPEHVSRVILLRPGAELRPGDTGSSKEKGQESGKAEALRDAPQGSEEKHRNACKQCILAKGTR